MHFENIIIVSNFLDRVIDKYKNIGAVKYKWLRKYTIDELNITEVKKELLRITISCNIEELKNIFYRIQPQRKTLTNQTSENINIVVYCNNQNKHSPNIIDIFDDYSYNLVIEIYNDEFKPFLSDLFPIVIDIDEMNIFGLGGV